MNLTALAALAALCANVHGQGIGGSFIIGGFANFMGRVDPIVNPGGIGSHVHSVLGASNFREVLNTPDEQQRAACISLNVGADKSNYWAPTLYYIHDNGTYAAMAASTRIYYKIANDTAVPFPKGMRIVTGTAQAKDKSDPRTFGVRVGCHGNQAGMLPNKDWGFDTCGDGDTVELSANFPSCGWANQSLDSWDHFSHLTWPVDSVHGYQLNVNGDACPPSHPVKYPTMMLVNFYQLGGDMPWRRGKDNVVLSNGDLTGDTFHADFVSGWDEGVLREAIVECGFKNGGVGPKVENCAVFKPSYQPAIGSYGKNGLCTYQGQVPNEDAGLLYPLTKLPGCNPVWPADQADKPTCSDDTPAPGWVSANAWKGGGGQNFPFVMTEENPGIYNVDNGAYFGKPRFGPWGTLGILPKEELMVSPAAMVNGWLPPDPSPNTFNKVAGMVDSSAWVGMAPGSDGATDTLATAPAGG